MTIKVEAKGIVKTGKTAEVDAKFSTTHDFFCG